jgi:putative transposase
VVDSQGWLVRVKVYAAHWQDREGLRYLLRRIPLYQRWTTLVLDGGYLSEPLQALCQQWLGVTVQIVKRSDTKAGFTVLPKCWVVERTFAWLGKFRRLSKAYEALPATGEAWIYAAMVHLMLRRLAHD